MTGFAQRDGKERGADQKCPVLIKSSAHSGTIVADIPFEAISSILSAGRIVILKGVFAPETLLDFRRNLRRWSIENPQHPHGKSPSTTPEENYHRIDDGLYKSAIEHIFHQYGFNGLDQLEDYIREPAEAIGSAMLGLQNAVAKTNFRFSPTGMRFRVLHYPSGGGFLKRHVHQLEPQRVGLVLSLTRKGIDSRSGGTEFLTPFGPVDVTADQDIGDIVLFRFDEPHSVSVVDEDQTLDWNSEAGKWSVVLELRENYYLNSTGMRVRCDNGTKLIAARRVALESHIEKSGYDVAAPKRAKSQDVGKFTIRSRACRCMCRSSMTALSSN